MSIKALAARVDTIGVWTRDGVSVAVKILDARKAYGRVEYLVTPAVGGAGSKWVGEAHVAFERGTDG